MSEDKASKMRYRLGLDLGTTSIGWAMIRLDKDGQPCAVIRAGSRIFSDGREPKTHDSLASVRRQARQARRTRDRKLRRKHKLINLLVNLGLFPQDASERRKLEVLDPYVLRVKGLGAELSPAELARALFHLAQRRGFKSNRKTDSQKTDETGALKSAIQATREQLKKSGFRTIGEWLLARKKAGKGLRARIREVIKENNKKTDVYDLYVDRAMVHDEFNLLWDAQAVFKPKLLTREAKDLIEETIFFQRPLRPVQPGRCTLIPEEPRAPLALPSQQQFRVYQEVNNLRLLNENLDSVELSLAQRDALVQLLEVSEKCKFTKLKKAIRYEGDFNLEDEKRADLKGNITSAILSKEELFGSEWLHLNLQRQDEIVKHLLETESELELVAWLKENCSVNEKRARAISNAKLPSGYGSLSEKALACILPVLKKSVVTYDKAVLEAGFDTHSQLSHLEQTGEILPELPYYGQYLTRHVGFGREVLNDEERNNPEILYGKIGNPTVHICLNQLRLVVNALIKKYGRPYEIVVEVARELKQGEEARKETMRRQAENQKRKEAARKAIAEVLGKPEALINGRDVEKWLLWEELNLKDTTQRLCPYTGRPIAAVDVLSPATEIDHILPFSRTLDDSRDNKVICYRESNRIKGNRTPWEARKDFEAAGWDVEGMLARAERMAYKKRFRFGEQGYEIWLQDYQDFVARALTDTQYVSRVAREYLTLVCPKTRCIPGRLTAILRGKFGLNSILDPEGNKNRKDHRHHAIDACVIAVTDQGMLQRFATANASAKQKGIERLVDDMPLPWPTYFDSVERAIQAIKVSHRPDHSHEGQMLDKTAYGPVDNGDVWRAKGAKKDHASATIIKISDSKAQWRHGINEDGSTKAYKGYIGGSNYCIELTASQNGKWEGKVVSTFEAYQRKRKGLHLRPEQSEDGRPILLRLMINDIVQLKHENRLGFYVVKRIASSGQVFFLDLHSAEFDPKFQISRRPGTMQTSDIRLVTISPLGDVHVHRLGIDIE